MPDGATTEGAPPADAPTGPLAAARSALADPDLRAHYLAFAASAFAWAVFERALPLYFEAVGAPLALLGVALGAGNALALVAEPVAGLAADAVDRAALGAVAGAALGGLLAAFAAVRVPLALAALVALAPAVRQFLTNAATPAVGAAVEDGAEGLGWALRDVGLYLGGAAGLLAATAATAAAGDVGAAFLAPGVALAGAGGVLWRRREGATGGRKFGLRAAVSSVRDAVGEADPVGAFRAVPNRGTLARLCVVEALAVLGGGTSLFLLPAYAVVVGVPRRSVLLAFAAYGVAAVPVSLYGGGLADRRSRKRLSVANYAAEAAMLAGFALAAGVPGVVAASPTSADPLARWFGPALFAVGLALYVAQTAFEPAVLAYFFDRFDDDVAGRAWSVEGVVAKAAGVVAPVAGGVLYARSPRLPFVVGAVLLACAAGVALTLPPDEERP